MSLSKSKCWYTNNCLHFLKCVVPSVIEIERLNQPCGTLLPDWITDYSIIFFLFIYLLLLFFVIKSTFVGESSAMEKSGKVKNVK